MTLNFDQLFPTLNSVTAQGTIRTQPEDFRVSEANDVEFSETGEHLWLFVEKTSSNTDWTAQQVASACKVPARQVGYAGLKDRHAVTQQWFSVQLPKISEINTIKASLPAEITVLKHHWHSKKIKTGQLKHNQFTLIIRDVVGDQVQIENNIKKIIEQGVPNYFGPQRFGHNMGNIEKAKQWFEGKSKVNNKNMRGLLISTARSHIFNCIVAMRVKDNSWNKAITGDILQLNKSHSWFPSSDASNDEIVKRLNEFDIHLTAALWGEDDVQSQAECAQLENQIAEQFPIYHLGFEKFRVKQDRRSMRINPIDLNFAWKDEHLTLDFKLLPGAYATGVLREILKISE